jgi:hypothetical protein
MSATEPYEAGWASEIIIFVRALQEAKGPLAGARVQISPDGMRWVDEGTSLPLPTGRDEVSFARIHHFGNWVRIAAVLPEGQEVKVLVTIHAKA